MMAPSKSNPFCEKMRAQFDDFRDGEISPLLKGVVSKHVKSCAACRKEFRILELSIELTKKKSAPDVPARLLKKVIKELQSGGNGGTPARAKIDPKLGLQGTT